MAIKVGLEFTGKPGGKIMEVETRLVTYPDPKKADLYLPREEWKELVAKLGSNKLTVVLRIEGVD